MGHSRVEAQRAVQSPELGLPAAIVESEHQFVFAFNMLWDEEDLELTCLSALQFGRNTSGAAEIARGALASAGAGMPPDRRPSSQRVVRRSAKSEVVEEGVAGSLHLWHDAAVPTLDHWPNQSKAHQPSRLESRRPIRRVLGPQSSGGISVAIAWVPLASERRFMLNQMAPYVTGFPNGHPWPGQHVDSPLLQTFVAAASSCPAGYHRRGPKWFPHSHAWAAATPGRRSTGQDGQPSGRPAKVRSCN